METEEKPINRWNFLKIVKKSDNNIEGIQHSCIVRLLDDSDPITISYKVSSMLCFRLVRLRVAQN